MHGIQEIFCGIAGASECRTDIVGVYARTVEQTSDDDALNSKFASTQASGPAWPVIAAACFNQTSASHSNPLSAVIHEIAKARDSRNQPLAFKHAQRLPAGGSCMSMPLAEASDRRCSVTWSQGPVRDLLTQDDGQAHVGPRVRQLPVS